MCLFPIFCPLKPIGMEYVHQLYHQPWMRISIQPKNITHVLWRNINTTTVQNRWFDRYKDNNRQLINSSTRGTATLHPDLNRSAAVSLSPQTGHDRSHLKSWSVLKPHSYWPDDMRAQNKNYIWWRCLASVLSSFRNSLKQSQKIAEDMKIYNSQLVMSLVYRST